MTALPHAEPLCYYDGVMAYVSLAAARARAREHTPDSRARFQQAWAVARQAAEFLRTHYSVEKIAIFGSLLDEEQFTVWSDVDLAVWGLPAAEYYEAVARVLTIGGDIAIDLVRVESCRPPLKAEIDAGTLL